MPLAVFAQNITVSGVVTDSNNEPIAGTTVLIKNTTRGTITNGDGKYTLEVPSNATIVFSFIGLAPSETVVDGRTNINMMLASDPGTSFDDQIVVGYGSQKKVTLTGAIAGVRGDEMRQTKNENPQNMLTGRIAGVRVWQKSSEPGTYSNNFDIRGMGAPLIVIDGIPRTSEEFQRMNPNDIAEVSVLKDASAAIYGVRAANGVVLITTKKGTSDGKVSVSYNGSFTFQKPSGMPVLANTYDAMTLFNERSMNNISGGSILYPESTFEEYRNGTRRSTDWTELMFSKFSPQTQHDVSITGGNDKTQYFIGMGYFQQEGFFKSGDLNYNKYNLRSNITTEIAKGLKFELNLSGLADQRNTPYNSSIDIIRNYWRQGTLYPAYADPENTMLNYDGLDLQQNSVAMMTADVSGYNKYEQKYFQSSATLSYDLGLVSPYLQGLSAKAMYSFDYRMDNNTSFRKEYSQYSYNKVTQSYDSNIYATSSPNSLRREMYDKRQVLSQYLLNYDRTFGDHKVTGLLGWEVQNRQGDNFYAQSNLAFGLPYMFVGTKEGQQSGMNSSNSGLYETANSAVIGRVNYAYQSRYLAEFQFREDGSSKFAKGHQWGFFPSMSVGWRVSEEPFFKSIDALAFVNQLKLRASYGSMGDDLGSDWNYEWAQGYNYITDGGNQPKGNYNEYAPGYVFGGSYINVVSPKPVANENISWFTSKTFDIGVDFEGWDGLFGFSFDYFDRRREGRFARSRGTMPTVIGAEAPLENLDSDRHYGVDLELTHRNKIGEVSYKVKAIGTVSRQQYMTAVEKGPWANSYDRWRNDNLTQRFQGVQFGYESAGRYQDWKDIRTYNIYKDRDVLPGDYKYEDWNGDGEINAQDEHPYAYDQTPWLNYSLSLSASYRRFDVSMLLQGSAMGSMEYKEPLYSIFGNGILEQYLDRWHPVDPSADPYDPATKWVEGYYGYTGHYPRGNSSFNRVSTAYLRLKSIEIGYTVPKINAMSTMSLRVFANAYNMFTITGVKFVDPEHPDDELGRLYPLNKTFTLGASLSF